MGWTEGEGETKYQTWKLHWLGQRGAPATYCGASPCTHASPGPQLPTRGGERPACCHPCLRELGAAVMMKGWKRRKAGPQARQGWWLCSVGQPAGLAPHAAGPKPRSKNEKEVFKGK